MAEGWDLVAQERRAFADLIEGLSAEQAGQPSLCGHWTVHQVAAHLLTFTELSLPAFMFNMARNGFDYDKAADKIAQRFASESSIPEIAALLRARAGKKSALPMFPPEMTLADVTIHRQDIRRALGLGTDLDEDVARTVLSFLTTRKQAKNIYDPSIIDGLRLEATDIGWSHGSGAEVTGPAEAIMMALAGRPVGDDIGGEGAAKLSR
jgi:uncharacterized protein (TIGR03083 family)